MHMLTTTSPHFGPQINNFLSNLNLSLRASHGCPYANRSILAAILPSNWLYSLKHAKTCMWLSRATHGCPYADLILSTLLASTCASLLWVLLSDPAVDGLLSPARNSKISARHVQTKYNQAHRNNLRLAAYLVLHKTVETNATHVQMSFVELITRSCGWQLDRSSGQRSNSTSDTCMKAL